MLRPRPAPPTPPRRRPSTWPRWGPQGPPATPRPVFAIPQLGVPVPLYGVPDDGKSRCDDAPSPLSTAHAAISFTFRTGGRGMYRWQCFVPCAAGFIQGFGGPMQTVGYMEGF